MPLKHLENRFFWYIFDNSIKEIQYCDFWSYWPRCERSCRRDRQFWHTNGPSGSALKMRIIWAFCVLDICDYVPRGISNFLATVALRMPFWAASIAFCSLFIIFFMFPHIVSHHFAIKQTKKSGFFTSRQLFFKNNSKILKGQNFSQNRLENRARHPI